MSGLLHNLLVLAGLRAPRRAPSARGRAGSARPAPRAAAGATRRPTPSTRPSQGRAQSRPVAPARRAPAPRRPEHGLDDVFADLAQEDRAGGGAARVPERRGRPPAPVPRRPRRSASLSGPAMLALAIVCVGLGGWLGNQVQAYAAVMREPADAMGAAMRPFDSTGGLRY